MSGGHGGGHGVLRGVVPPVVCLLRRRHGLRRGDGARYRVSVVTFEPSDEGVNGRVNLIPIAVAIGSDGEIFHDLFTPRLIGEAELSRRLFRGAEKVGNSLLVFLAFVGEEFLECFLVSSVGRPVDLVGDEFAGQGCHGLDEPRQNLVQVFIFLLCMIQSCRHYNI